MPRALISVILIALLSAMVACGDIDIGNQHVIKTNKIDVDTPEGAREMIARLNIPYTVDEFVERARQSDEVAVDLFLMARMNLNAKDINGVTALGAAEEAGHENIIALLEDWTTDESECGEGEECVDEMEEADVEEE